MRAEAYAKVTFTLEVFGKRADGYHALRSVVMPISLSDTLDIEAADDGAITSDTGYDDDLCVKAARILRSSVSSLPSSLGATIHVAKRIPAGGGLGGGSADAAVVLRALNELWKVGLSREELAEVGAQVGSDVPALVLGGPVIMEGRGEKVASIEQSEQSNNLALLSAFAAFTQRSSSYPVSLVISPSSVTSMSSVSESEIGITTERRA